MRTDSKTLWYNIQKVGKKRYVISTIIMMIFVFFIGDIKGMLMGRIPFSRDRFFLKCIELIACVSLSYIFSMATWNNIKRQAERQTQKEENNSPKITYCYYCGEELQAGEEVCNNCGKKLEI